MLSAMAARSAPAMSPRMMTPDLVVLPDGMLVFGLVVGPAGMTRRFVTMPRRVMLRPVTMLCDGMATVAHVMAPRMGYTVAARAGCWPEVRKRRRRWRHVGRRRRPLLWGGLLCLWRRLTRDWLLLRRLIRHSLLRG